ncbi:hypothetical protein ULF88_01655 [Halopseudomonas pachastrellae]|nr:hypothetical protein [Halopseudomonas pachastrellae]
MGYIEPTTSPRSSCWSTAGNGAAAPAIDAVEAAFKKLNMPVELIKYATSRMAASPMDPTRF